MLTYLIFNLRLRKWFVRMRISRLIDSLSIKAGFIATAAILTLGGCIGTTYPYMRTETAQRIASPAWMIKRDISANAFLLRAYERIHDRGGAANIYIEGEGSSVLNDATPTNPLALHLASKDKADNIIYIARPCQYTGMSSPAKQCDAKYWHEASFSPEVIDAYNTALDDISKRYDIREFNLIGFSGGAAIATIIAADRKDVRSLRTVAGILDHKTYTHMAQKPAMSDSINPAMKATSLTKMPQYHFIGGRDSVVPPAVLHSYLQSMPPSNCIQTMLIQEAKHDAGWVDKWPELLELPTSCFTNGSSMPDTLIPATMPQDLPYTVREKPVKP